MKNCAIFILSILMFGSGITNATPKIILKLDDLSVKNGICPCSSTFDYLVSMKIKAGFGAIADRFDSTALTTLNHYLNAVNPKGEKLFEIWHHGLDHVRPEFLQTNYDYQKFHFDEADKIIRNLLGIQMHSFGTPYNGSDSVTSNVISENSNYKVFMFSSLKKAEKAGTLNLDNRVNIENGTGNPEFKLFMENYAKNKEKYLDYMVLQGHPNMWTAEKIDQFKKIVEFLISEGCEFVTPYEYYQSLK
jgi:peptidoglycan/xylan/chitin deacetylase (PgdA/CDA1 family)